MEPVSGGITHGKDEGSIIGSVQPVESVDIEPVLNEDLGEALNSVSLRAALESIGHGVSHMGGWIGDVEVLTVPARWEGDGRSKAVGAGSEACGHALCVDIGMAVASVASPSKLTSVRAHGHRIIASSSHASGNHFELLGELDDIAIELARTVAVLVVNLVVRLLGNTGEGSVPGILEVKVGHLDNLFC